MSLRDPRSPRATALAALAVLAALATAPTAPAEEPARAANVRVLVEEAPFPTAVELTADDGFLYTDRCGGRLLVADANGTTRDAPFATVADVDCEGERGLLDVAVRRDADGRPLHVYAFAHVGSGADAVGRVLRWPLDPATWTAAGPASVVVDGLPTARIHNGGRIGFGPLDGHLHVTLGENNERAAAQDPGDLRGSVLRYTAEGGVPADNPFGAANPVLTIGHRNPFGLAFDRNGRAWVTENGLDDADEINRLEAGGNYGWPQAEGASGEEGARSGLIDPLLEIRPVVAPTGLAFGRNALYWTAWNTGTLHRMPLAEATGEPVAADAVIYEHGTAGLLDVAVRSDGRLLVAAARQILLVDDPAAPGDEEPEPEPDPDPSPPPDREPPSRDDEGPEESGTTPALPLLAAVALGLVLLAGAVALALAGRRR